MGLGLDSRNVRCIVLKSLTHFEALLGFCGNTYCLPIKIGRSWNLVGVKRVIVLGKLANLACVSSI